MRCVLLLDWVHECILVHHLCLSALTAVEIYVSKCLGQTQKITSGSLKKAKKKHIIIIIIIKEGYHIIY